MRQYPKYQTICDYAPTISHDMSVTHDIKRCETPMQKLQEISFPWRDYSNVFSKNRNLTVSVFSFSRYNIVNFPAGPFLFLFLYDKIILSSNKTSPTEEPP
jgi:hypothetical protein